MSSAVVAASNITALPIDERGELITLALEESKAWLDVATKGTNPTPVAEFKAWAATVAEMAKQKGLAKDIQLDAQEMVRRAERAIGVTIRHGQAAGEIATVSELQAYAGKMSYAQRNSGNRPFALPSRKPSPGEFIAQGSMTRAGITPLTDGLSDEQFEEAVALARAEQNMSNRNLVRKAQQVAGHLPFNERIAKIRELAAQGHTSGQIAHALGATAPRAEEHVRQQAAQHGISILADELLRNTHRISPSRVVRETVQGVEGFASAVQKVSLADLNDLDADEARIWALSLAQSLRTLQKLQKELKHCGK